MEVERGSVKLGLSNELIKEAVIQSMDAQTQDHHYITKSKKHGAGSSSSTEVLILAFKGSFKVNGFYQDDHFGETNVDCNLFPSLLRIGEGKLAKVNGSTLQMFLDLLNNSGFKSEVTKAVKKNKKILFTGHSSGGAIASLATLWMLDEYARKQKLKLPIGCVTFGSPLIGDGTLAHAVRREKWAGHFTHFVMELDIVPRMMLASKTSIQNYLPNILEYFQQKVNSITSKRRKSSNKNAPERINDHDQLLDGDQAVEFFENVLINASTVASHDAFDLMEPTNSLKEKLSVAFVKVSPYRPFGDFVFCTRHETQGSISPRQHLVVENPNAVLQLLFYLLQMPNEDQNLTDFARNSLAENSSYEKELNNNGLQLQNMVYLKNLNQHLLTPDGTTGDAVRTSNKALFELTSSAKWCLLAVEEAEKRKKENEDQIDKSMRKFTSNKAKTEQKTIEDMLKEIGEYKEKHGDGNIDYYEAFKLQNTHDDFVANVNRLEQAKIWDVIIEMVMRRDLPDEFEAWDELVDLGTKFRRLTEPLDIANYYRHRKGDGYLGVRPKRYKFTQRWYEHANVTGFELVSESNFIAEIEELKKEVEELKKMPVEDVKREIERIKNHVLQWKSDEKIVNNDVFWGDSILSELEGKLV